MIVAIAETARVWFSRLASPVLSAAALVTEPMGRACLLSFAVLALVGAWLNYCDETCGRARSDPAWNDGRYYSAPVGSYPDGSSWSGALDMAGNVSEWVSDWYGRYDGHESRNPVGPAQGHLRAIRGGSWFLTPVEARTTWRAGIGPGSWFDDLGFRCVMPVSR
jgi:formylglycine-generating enzyme required for sulfatase activity